MANIRRGAPTAPAGDEELFDQATNADTVEDFNRGGGEAEPEPAPAPEPQRHTVPLNELLDERDRRRQAEQRLQEFEAERQRVQEQPIDPIMRPDEYFDRRFAAAVDPLRRQFTMQLANANKALAAAQHGPELVEEAQKAFDAEVAAGRLHPAEHARVFTAANPFQAAVEWHNNRRLVAEVGNDPKAYRDRLLEEALSDPAFLGRALEAARAQASGRPMTVAPQRQAPRASTVPAQAAGRTPLPPSLNRQGPPGGQPPPLGEAPDADLYEEMTNPNKLTE
jgi:hypothetical protein